MGVSVSMKKILFFAFVCLTFTASSSFAQGMPGGSAPAKAAGAADKTCPPYDNTTMKADTSPIADVIDKNRDGKITHEEWQAAGAPENSFNYFMAKDEDKKGYVTRPEFLNEAPPDGLDANCDGKMTIKEFQDFDKKQSSGNNQSGNAPANDSRAESPQAQK
jgi:hypothetical protein